jgi:hypothetical protein
MHVTTVGQKWREDEHFDERKKEENGLLKRGIDDPALDQKQRERTDLPKREKNRGLDWNWK